MNINSILKTLGISKLKAAWTVLTGGVSGLLELAAKAFTALLRKANPDKLSYYADLSVRIAKFINQGLDLFVSNEKYRAAGKATVDGLESFAAHIADGEYTKEELDEDIDFIEDCIQLWKYTKQEKQLIKAGYIVSLAAVSLLYVGCASYKGGKVVDGTNLEIGLAVPGTEGQLTINALSYTAGLKVCGDDRTYILVTNWVAETNSYFGVVRTQRNSRMSAAIMPCPFCYAPTNGLAEATAETPKKKK